MTLAKAVVTGSIYRAPETRFAQNNVPVSSFVLNIGEKEEMLLRVISKRTALADVVSALGKDDKVLVEGRLQITSVKNENGNERKIFEIDANTIEPISATNGSGVAASTVSSDEEIVKFPKEEEFADELLGSDEVPF